MGAVISRLPNCADLDHSTLPDIASAKLPQAGRRRKVPIKRWVAILNGDVPQSVA